MSYRIFYVTWRTSPLQVVVNNFMRIANKILLNLDNVLRLHFKFISQYRKKHFI